MAQERVGRPKTAKAVALESQVQRTKKKKESLYWFLAVAILLSIALPAVVSGSLLIQKNYQRTLQQDSLSAAESYADLLEAGMTMPLWNVSPELGTPLLNGVVVDSAVLSVVVRSESGEVFLGYQRDVETLDESEAIVLQRDIQFEDESLGSVELTYSLQRAIGRAQSEAVLLVSIIVVQLLFSLVVISWVLHRRVLAPLRKLGAAAAGIAAGDLRTAIPALKNDECGQLAEQLETMRGGLEQNFHQLEKGVEERTRELRTVNRTLLGTLEQLQRAQYNLIQQEKLAALGALVAGVAHELNTPIGNGLTVASSLCEDHHDFQRQMAQGITRSALDAYLAKVGEGSNLVCRNLEKASELVSSFKQVAMDRTSVQRRSFSLMAIVNETLLTLSPTIKRTPFVVDSQGVVDVNLDGYPGPLGQVITNLVNNAVVHAFEGRSEGCITLTSCVQDGEVEFVVEDNGIGIEEANIPRIFDPFFTTKLGAGGSGLGMHIVHNIVTGMLGGSVTLTSEVNVGTRFVLRFPLSAPMDETEKAESQLVWSQAAEA